jgi:hypothetical protein
MGTAWNLHGGVRVLVGPRVFKLWFCSSAPFAGVSDLDASAASAVVGRRDPAVLLSLLLPAAGSGQAHTGRIALLNFPERHR